jgi:hypothetical protein
MNLKPRATAVGRRNEPSMSVLDTIEDIRTTSKGRYRELVAKAAATPDELTQAEGQELASLAADRGLALKSAFGRSVEADIALMREHQAASDAASKLEAIEPLALKAQGDVVRFQEETERLIKELKKSREPGLEAAVRRRSDLNGQYQAAMDARRRLVEIAGGMKFCFED